MPQPCDICGSDFEPKMISQRYCSRDCYKRAWPINNREKAAERQRLRRAANPQWYAAREPGYYRAYRGKLESKRPWHYLLLSRKREAAQRGLEFSLTNEWAESRWTGRCEVTDLPFEQNKAKGPWPFSPSVDRIDNTRGYAPDNTRFILWGVNALKGAGTDNDMLAIARAIVATIGRKGSPNGQNEPL